MNLSHASSPKIIKHDCLYGCVFGRGFGLDSAAAQYFFDVAMRRQTARMSANMSVRLQEALSMSTLNLSAEEVLSTTRAVRQRLDFDKPVTQKVIRECVALALQAPTGGNTQGWQFMVVFDADRRAALAELYRKGWALYKEANGSVFEMAKRIGPGARREQMVRVARSADYLADNLEKVPVLLIPCIPGRVETMTGPAASIGLASVYGSILPATWSYMLAARDRGLGTCWTTVHLMHEQAAAEILDIPYTEFTQCALIPTAYTIGKDFRPAARKSLDDVLHIDGW
jgi:nitroreductase